MSGILNLLLGSAAGVIKDAYFNLVTLLLNTTATNGAQNNTFLDSSTNNFSITRNGNTTQGTFTPFSQTGWSNYLQGSNSGFSFTGINIGTSQFTFEGWVYVPSFSTIQHMYGSAVNNDISVEINNATTIVIDQSAVGSQSFTVASMATNAWHHIAVVRNASVMTVFVDGVRSTTGTLSNTINYNNFAYIGYKSSGFALTGYVSNFRVVKAAVYDPTQSTITVPTTPLTSIANTVLLTCQSNRFVDNGPNAVTLTPTNLPTVQAFSPFAPDTAYSTSLVGGSGYFDGSGDYLTTASNASFAFGLGDFEVDFWIYATALPASDNNILNQNLSSGTPQFYIDSTGKLQYRNAFIGAVLTSNTTFTTGQWYYCVVSRVSLTSRMFINGVLDTSGADANNWSNTAGWYISNNSGSFTGYISNVRLVNGSGITSSTVPTAPLTAITNTVLLLNYTNAGIYDAAAKNDLETVGNAQVSTTQAKFGTNSMAFDGTGDYLLMPNNALLIPGSGDFSWEAWIYNATAAGSLNMYFDQTGGGLAVYRNSSGYIVVEADGVAGIVTSANTIPVNQWVHLAVTRAGNTARVFINGFLDASATNTTNIAGSSAISVGANPSGLFPFNGYIDDLRFTKGYARYTATFTPPAAAFPIQ